MYMEKTFLNVNNEKSIDILGEDGEVLLQLDMETNQIYWISSTIKEEIELKKMLKEGIK